jgi:hypothetical protein
MSQSLRSPISYLLGLGITYLVATTLGSAGCAGGEVFTEDDSNGSTTTTSSAGGSQAGGGGSVATGGSGGTEPPLPCGVDCSTIDTPDCTEAVCNEATAMCEVVSVANDTACDDGEFCTVDDTCTDGMCVGGPQNTCGMAPTACEIVTCDENADACTLTPGMNGDPCQDPNNQCQVNMQCTNGVCSGGVPTDCFFAPVPNECFEAVCNPANGICEPQPGNDGSNCVDTMDLCTVNKVCSAGVCQGGSPMDCSQLTQGCNLGICNVATGQCEAQAVMNGDPCDDLDSCTTGETCGAGQCTNGTAITNCVNADGCCPMGCTEALDDDCSCNVNLATTATPTTNGGGSGGFGPVSLNNGVDEAGCQASGCTGCFTWISNGTAPAGDYIQYDWPSAVQIGSMLLDLNQCGGSGCSGSGRGMASADIQYWNGAQYITAQTVTNNTGDVQVTFNPKITTDSLRVFNMTAVGNGCGQSSNTLIYEWYVWPGSNCMP